MLFNAPIPCDDDREVFETANIVTEPSATSKEGAQDFAS